MGHQLGRVRIAIGQDLVLGKPDIVFVHDRAGDGAESRQTEAEHGTSGLVQDDGDSGGLPALLAELDRGEGAAGGGDEVGSRGQRREFEGAVHVGAPEMGTPAVPGTGCTVTRARASGLPV